MDNKLEKLNIKAEKKDGEKLNDKALFPLTIKFMIFFCTVHQLENNDTRGVLLTQFLMVCFTAENIYLIELFFQ